MPSRVLSETVCTSEKIEKLNPFAEICYYRLWVNADDYGRMDARLPLLRARLFPLKEIPIGLMSDALTALQKAELVKCYNAGGIPYLYLTEWEAHQQIRVKREKYPPPPGWRSATPVGEARPDEKKDAHAGAVVSSSASSSASTSSSSSVFAARPQPASPSPTREQVRAFAREKGYAANPDTFFDYYTGTNWRTKKGEPVNWRAAFATWERREWHWANEQKAARGESCSFDAEDFFNAAVQAARRSAGEAPHEAAAP